jgi:hypothetical protein
MIRKNLVALLALAPALSVAQPAMAPPAPRGSAPPPAASAPAPARDAEAPPLAVDHQAPSTEPAPAPDTYTVKPGDTLWDLSGRFLNNPWYWPKIWSYNPEITNPHWIYPGNLLKFFPSAEEAPTRVEPVGPGAPIAAAETEAAEAEAETELEPVKELEDLSRGDLKAPQETDAVAVVGPYKIGFVPERKKFARREAFVTPRELAESGTIGAAFEEKSMLTSLDKAYAQFPDRAGVKVGETYVVYKTDRAIVHPDRPKEIFGYLSTVLGSAKVVAVDDRAVSLTIVQSFEPIERGALLGPWTQKFFRPVDRTPNKQAVEGKIIAAQVDLSTQYGENHVVFVDRGEQDGVQEGNVFKVLRSGDQYKTNPTRGSWDPRLPVESIGDLLVIDVKEKASTALITKSLKELMVGDRVEMRPDGGSGGN